MLISLSISGTVSFPPTGTEVRLRKRQHTRVQDVEAAYTFA